MYKLDKVYREGQDPEKVGPILDAKIKELQQKVEKDFLKNYEPIDEETEKVAKKAFKKIQKYFKENNINIKDINFSDIEIFTTDKEDNPNYDNSKGIIVIPETVLQNADNKKLEADIIHEMYRFISGHKLEISLTDEIKKDFLIKNKTGYDTFYDNFNDKDERRSNYKHFQAFNEGITDLSMAETLKTYDYVSYNKEVLMIKNIMKNAFPDDESITKFLKGYFDGGLMHLRRIEKEYGKGSLRMLAYLPTDAEIFYKYSENEKLYQMFLELNELIRDFFIEGDVDKRDEIKKEIEEVQKNISNF